MASEEEQNSSIPRIVEIDTWSDIVCPWCYIGHARLVKAAELENIELVEQIHSYELSPEMPIYDASQPPISHADYLVKERGMAREDVEQIEQTIAELAAELNIPFVPGRTQASTRPIHRVVKAVEALVGTRIAADLFHQLQDGYFAGRLNPFDPDVLADCAANVAADHEVIEEALSVSGGKYDQMVKNDIDLASQLDVRGVPFTIFNSMAAAPGALTLISYRRALRRVLDMKPNEN